MAFDKLTEKLRSAAIAVIPNGSLRRGIKNLYWSLPYRFRAIDPATDVVRAMAKTGQSVRFVQVGANDGSTGDFLFDTVLRHRWRGVLIEPHPQTFQSLSDSYQGVSHLQLANVAISAESGSQTFYYLPDNPLVASFDEKHVHKFAKNALDVQAVSVDCLTLMELLTQYESNAIDLLAVDTEGYDAEIIRSIDFDNFDCQAILFETVHLSEADKADCEQRLSRAGYWFLPGQYDGVAICKNTTNSSLRRLAQAYGVIDG